MKESCTTSTIFIELMYYVSTKLHTWIVQIEFVKVSLAGHTYVRSYVLVLLFLYFEVHETTNH